MKIVRYNVDSWGYRYNRRVLDSGKKGKVSRTFWRLFDSYIKRYRDSWLRGTVRLKGPRKNPGKIEVALPGGSFFAVVVASNERAEKITNGSRSW